MTTEPSGLTTTLDQVKDRNTMPLSELTVDERYLRAVREFFFTIKGHPVHISRYDNHGSLLPDAQWVARIRLGTMNHWYAAFVDDKWMFEGGQGAGFDTYQEAYTAAKHGMDNMITAGLWSDPNTAGAVRKSARGSVICVASSKQSNT